MFYATANDLLDKLNVRRQVQGPQSRQSITERTTSSRRIKHFKREPVPPVAHPALNRIEVPASGEQLAIERNRRHRGLPCVRHIEHTAAAQNELRSRP